MQDVQSNRSRGEQIKLLQETLNETPAGAGMDLKADGIFGAKTEKAVRQFQADHGLTVDGVVGKKTWKALGSTALALSSRVERSGAEGPPSADEAVSAPEQPQEDHSSDGAEMIQVLRLRLLETRTALADALNIITNALEEYKP